MYELQIVAEERVIAMVTVSILHLCQPGFGSGASLLVATLRQEAGAHKDH